MKRYLKKAVLVALLATSTIALANNVAYDFNIVKAEGKMISFTISEAKEAAITIFDKDNKVVHTEYAKANKAIHRTYDLSHLPKGTYTLQAETDSVIEKYTVEISANEAFFINKNATKTFKPVIETKDGLITLQVLNLKNSPVEVTVFDIYDNVLYTQTFEGINIAKKFSVENAKDDVRFVVKFDNETFVKTLSL